MKRLVIALTSLLPLLTAGCANLTFNPETSVQHQVMRICPPNTAPENLTVLGTRRTAGRAIVLYDLSCQAQDETTESIDFFAETVFVRRGPLWQYIGAGGIGNSDAFPPSELILFSEATIHSGMGDRVNAISGRILSPDVDTIEVTLDSGRTLQDDGTGDVFALLIPPSTVPCELRVLGQTGQVLRRESLNSSEREACPTL